MADTRVNPLEPIKTLPKYCSRCHGKLFLDRDAYGAYLTCLCGNQINLSNSVEEKLKKVLK